MTTMRVSIRKAREKFSELVHMVNANGERIILTSRDKPKAVIVSLRDAETLVDRSLSIARRRIQIERIHVLRERLATERVNSDSTETLREIRENRLGIF